MGTSKEHIFCFEHLCGLTGYLKENVGIVFLKAIHFHLMLCHYKIRSKYKLKR